MFRLFGRLAFYAVVGAASIVVGSALLAVLGAVLGVVGAILPFVVIGAVVWVYLRPALAKAKEKLPLEDLPEKRQKVARGLRHAAVWGCVHGAAGLAQCRQAGIQGCRWAYHKSEEWTPTVSSWWSRLREGIGRHAPRVASVVVELGCGAAVGGFLGLLAGGQTQEPEPYLLAGIGIGALLGLAVGLVRPGTVREVPEV